jgi:hypothetical protein
LAAGGLFINADNYQVNYLASWDGSRWSGMGFGPRQTLGASNPVYCFTKLTDGTLILGGAFTDNNIVINDEIQDYSNQRQVYANRIALFHRNASHFSGIPSNYGIGKYTYTAGVPPFPGITNNNVFALCVHRTTTPNTVSEDFIIAAGDFTSAFNNTYGSTSNTVTTEKIVRIRPRYSPEATADTFLQERFSLYRYLNATSIYNSTKNPATTLFSNYYDAQPYGKTNKEIWPNVNKQRIKACVAGGRINPTTTVGTNVHTVIPWCEPAFAGRNTEWAINLAYEADEIDCDTLWKNWYDQGIRTFFIFNANFATNYPVNNSTNDINKTSNTSNLTKKSQNGWLIVLIIWLHTKITLSKSARRLR